MSPLDLRKIRLLETFQGEVTPDEMSAFQSNLGELVRDYKTDSRLPALLKNVLETLREPLVANALQNRLQAGAAPDTTAPRTVQTIAARILRSEKMETMLNSTIEALESDALEERLLAIPSLEEDSLSGSQDLPKEVWDTMGLIPQSDLDGETIRSAIALCNGVTDAYQRSRITLELATVSPDQRADVVRKAAPIVQDILQGFCGHHRSLVIRELGRIPANRRAEVIATARPFFHAEFDQFDRMAELLRTIALIASDGSSPAVMQGVCKLFEGNFEKAWVLREAIEKIPVNQREEVIPVAVSVCEGLESGDFKGFILQKILTISPDQRSDVIEKALPLLTGITNGYQKETILRAIRDIPGEQRSDVIEKALPLLTGITDGDEKAYILRAIRDIPGEQRSDVIEKALPLLTGITNGYQKETILRAIQKIPGEQRSDVIEKALPLLTGITNCSQKEPILRAVQEIPGEQRSDVIEKALPLLTGITDGSHKVDILRVVQNIPPELRSDVIEKTLPLLTGITYGFENILRAVQEIPGEQRSDVIEKALPLLTDITDGYEKANILRAVQEIPGEQRSDVIEKALPLLTDITNGYEKANILQAIQNIPPELRSDVIEKALPLLTGITYGSHKVVILRAIQEIPPELRFDVIEKAPLFLESIENGKARAAILKKLAAVSKEIEGDWLDLFSQIAKTRPPSLRHKLADLMLTCLHDGSAKQRFASPQFQTLFSRKYMKPFRLLAALLWDEEEPDEELKAAAGVLSSSRYKDSEKKTIVLSSFIALFHTPLLATSEKKRCLGVIFPKDAIHEIETKKIALENKNQALKIALRTLRKGPDPSLQEEISSLRNEIERLEEEIPQTEAALIDQINQSLSLMESIGNLGFFKNLEKVEKPEDLTHILTALFKEITTVSDIENLSEKYLKTFGTSRNPESLFIYAGKLKQLPEAMRAPALTCLKHYVEDVLNGDFFTSRYDEESSIHLKTVFQDNPELKPLWTEGTSVNLEEFCEEDPLSVSSSFDPKKYFMQRVLTDGHISQEKVPYLTAYLTDSNTTQEELSARIQRVTEALERDPENVSLQEELGILRLQRELISLLQSPSSREKLEIYSTGIKPLIEPALRGEKQFKRDLTDLESALASQTKQSSHSGWTVVDSDDPIDLLLCGTDVIGSCQNIHGGPMNRCLIGYLSDGKNRLVAVKNEKGEIAGRSILRILWDPEQKRPVLFKERAYFKPPENKKVSDALDRMCVEKAKKLRLPLVAQVSEQPNVRPYPRPIVSVASRAPFEYSDAGGGATDGTFKVRGVLVADFSTENKRREDV